MVKVKKEIEFFKCQADTDKAKFSLNIFELLKKDSTVSVNEAAKILGMPEDIVADYINSCVKKDLLKIAASGDGDLVKFNSDGRKVLGIGFSGEKCILTLMDLGGKVLDREQIPMRVLSGLKGRIKEFKEIITEIGRGTKLRGSGVTFIGLAIPEEMDDKNPRCKEILIEGVNKLFGCDVFFAKGSTAAGYGEKDFGEKGDRKNVLYMHTDIGIGVVIKDEMIYEPSEGYAKETYLRSWRQFDIVNTAKGLVTRGVGTDIVNMVGGDIDKITLAIVLDAAEKDELSEDLVKRSALALGVRVAYLVNIYDPDIVLLGGGTDKKEGNFAGLVNESAARFLLKDRAKIKIIPGVLGQEASSVGAALLCRRELFMEV